MEWFIWGVAVGMVVVVVLAVVNDPYSKGYVDAKKSERRKADRRKP